MRLPYPFHPELLDLMYHRWGSLPTYQRTRGALQFLATVIGALWKQRDSAGPLIGPGDVSLGDDMVRSTFFSQVGEREAMKSVLDSDLLGAGARCRRVDEAIAADAPAYQAYRPGTRLTRALALYSFGAKPGEDRGVLRSELLAAVQMPGLPADVLDVALQGLSDHLLYIHTSARRYRFEKRPNLNKLVDDEVRKIEPHEVAEQVRRELEKRLSARGGFEIWPKDSSQVPDRKPRFTVVFLGPERALEPHAELEKLALEWTERCGGTKRSYRNALAFALPGAGALDSARTAARRVMAVQQLLDDKSRHGFEKDDIADVGLRKQRAVTDLVAAVRQMYPTILMPVAAPRTAKEPVRLERFEIQGFQSLSAGLMESIYRALENWVFADAKPRKLVSCVRLGDGELGGKAHWISGPELVDQFFGSVHFPKLLTLSGLKQSVAQGVSRAAFGYVMGGTDSTGSLKVGSSDSLTFGEEVSAEDIDLSEGSYVVSAELARTLRQGAGERGSGRTLDGESDDGGQAINGTDTGSQTGVTATPSGLDDEEPGPKVRTVRLRFKARGGQLYKAFAALQLLNDWADEHFEASVVIDAAGSQPLDQNWYEMSVLMPLDEEGVEIKR